jgi:hypothetical protein
MATGLKSLPAAMKSTSREPASDRPMVNWCDARTDAVLTPMLRSEVNGRSIAQLRSSARGAAGIWHEVILATAKAELPCELMSSPLGRRPRDALQRIFGLGCFLRLPQRSVRLTYRKEGRCLPSQGWLPMRNILRVRLLDRASQEGPHPVEHRQMLDMVTQAFPACRLHRCR